MKIDLTNIPPGGKKVDFKFEPEWWPPDSGEDRILGFERPVSGWISIQSAGKKIAVKGFLSTRLVLQCDRCLDPYGVDFNTDFSFYLSTAHIAGISEIELSEEDLDLDFIQGNYLDVDQTVREQVIVNLPMKSLCAEGCKGICPICGRNLNKERCSCPSGRELSLD